MTHLSDRIIRIGRFLGLLVVMVALWVAEYLLLQLTFSPMPYGSLLSIAGHSAADERLRGYAVVGGRIEHSLEIASQFWAERHRSTDCEGAIRAVVVWHQSEMQSVAASPGDVVMADTAINGCTIQYSRQKYYHESWLEFCITTVHEYGHVVGYGDFPSDRRSIMYEAADKETYRLPACENSEDEEKYAPTG